MWQASLWAWCAAGAVFATTLCALWLGTAFLGANPLRRHFRLQARVLAPLILAALLGAVLGAAGHRLKTQANLCDEQGIAWSECRVAWSDPDSAAP